MIDVTLCPRLLRCFVHRVVAAGAPFFPRSGHFLQKPLQLNGVQTICTSEINNLVNARANRQNRDINRSLKLEMKEDP